MNNARGLGRALPNPRIEVYLDAGREQSLRMTVPDTTAASHAAFAQLSPNFRPTFAQEEGRLCSSPRRGSSFQGPGATASCSQVECRSLFLDFGGSASARVSLSNSYK